jgi:hypothetical protein
MVAGDVLDNSASGLRGFAHPDDLPDNLGWPR